MEFDKIKKAIGALAASVGIIFGAYMFIDERYAQAKEVAQLSKSVDRIKVEQTYQKALDNYYDVKNLSKKYPSDDSLKDNLERAKKEVDFLEDKLKELE